MPSGTWLAFTIGLTLALAACGSSPLSTSDDGAPSGGGASGPGGGSATMPSPVPSAVDLVPLYDAPPGFSATALAFDPLRIGELWVTLRQPPSTKPCLMIATSGCAALEGEVALVKQATSDSPQMTIKKDGNAWHFMRRPTSIAFGDNGHLATCGEARTDNYEDEPIDYAGPVLWSSDPAIFGATPKPDQNGTHLDMLHESPFCMGIAFDHDNVYWVFNGQSGSLDHYDFHAPHVVGGEDHSDGELERYVTGQLSRVPEIPSHMQLDAERHELYVADTGNGRVVRLATDSGTVGADVTTFDPIVIHHAMAGAVLDTLVPAGTLTAPSGLTLTSDALIVTDNATSKIWWFARDGSPIGSVTTDLPAGSLSGITVGPDAQLYVTDLLIGAAYRVQPRPDQ
jgi:sugar lactone lactonase YvrE